MTYDITKAEARTLLNEVIKTRGFVNLDGYDTDDYLAKDFWEAGELETVQALITKHRELTGGYNPSENVLKVKRLNARAKLPVRSKELDAGYDICTTTDCTIEPGTHFLFPTGFALETPPGTYAAVHPRSGLAAKAMVTVFNAPGTVDEGYRGEVIVNLINHGPDPVKIQVGDRIAQLIIQKYETPAVVEVDELSSTERGSDGHGSTGV